MNVTPGANRIISGGKRVGGKLVDAGKKIGGKLVDVGKKVRNYADPIKGPKRLFKKIGDIGGIDYHDKTNPITGVSARVRGNPNKQNPIEGFNRPGLQRAHDFAVANPGKSNRGKVIGNTLKELAGPIIWNNGGQKPRK